MLSTNAALSFDYLFEHLAIGCLLSLFHDHVHMYVSVSNVTVPHNFSFDALSQPSDEVGPLFDLVGKVISYNFTFLLGCNGDLLSNLPDLTELPLVVGHDSIVEVLAQYLKDFI
jgi:hypothetical protein